MSAIIPRLPCILAVAVLASGCVTTESVDQLSFPSEGIRGVNVEVDQGDLSITGAPVEAATVEARVYGYAGKEDVATRNHDGVSWEASVEDGFLNVRSRSTYMQAGADLAITLPPASEVLVDSRDDLRVEGIRGRIFASGDDISLEDCQGVLELAADGSLDAEDLRGQLLLVANGSVNASVVPEAGDVVHLVAGGGAQLALPWGTPIDLEVWGDPEYEVVVDDFAFGRLATAPGYFRGVAGPGAVKVQIEASGGPVYVTGTW